MRHFFTGLFVFLWLSSSLFGQDTREFIDNYSRLLAEHDYPGSAEIALQIAEMQWEAEKVDEAIFYATKAVESANKTSSNLLGARSYFYLGKYQVEKVESSGNNLQSDIKKLNTNAVKNLKEADAYYLKTSEKHSEEHIWVSVYGGKAYINLGKFKRATSVLEVANNQAEKNKYIDAVIESSRLLSIAYGYLQERQKENYYRSKQESFEEFLRSKDEIEARDEKIKDKQKQIEIKENELRERNIELELSNLKKLEYQSQLKRKQLESIFLYVVGGFLLLIFIGAYFSYKKIQKSNEELKQKNREVHLQKNTISIQKSELQKEKEKVESLLGRMLPTAVLDEFKKNGNIKPVFYREVSILFADFAGFTVYASTKSPNDIVKELDACFSVFDKIVEKHGLEKIKTIGDGYMAAGGVPVKNTSNALEAVKAALEMMEFINHRKMEKEKIGEKYFGLRIGIHTGPVVAGIVGRRKFAYDIWGDAVNIASRMESMGEEGRINISSDTYNRVKEDYFYTYRGKLDVKHKGQMAMYFVDGMVKYVSK